MNSQQIRNVVVWGALIALVLIMITVSQNTARQGQDDNTISYSQLLQGAESGEVETVEYDQDKNLIEITAGSLNGKTVNVPRLDFDLADTLTENGVNVKVSETRQPSAWTGILSLLLPFLLILGIAVFMMRSAGSWSGTSAPR